MLSFRKLPAKKTRSYIHALSFAVTCTIDYWLVRTFIREIVILSWFTSGVCCNTGFVVEMNDAEVLRRYICEPSVWKLFKNKIEHWAPTNSQCMFDNSINEVLLSHYCHWYRSILKTTVGPILLLKRAIRTEAVACFFLLFFLLVLQDLFTWKLKLKTKETTEVYACFSKKPTLQNCCI